MKHLKNFKESKSFDTVDIENIFLELEEDSELDFKDSSYYEGGAYIYIYIKEEGGTKDIGNVTEFDRTIKLRDKQAYLFKKLKIACLRLDYYGYKYNIGFTDYEVTIKIEHKDFKYNINNIFNNNSNIDQLTSVIKNDYNLSLLNKTFHSDRITLLIAESNYNNSVRKLVMDLKKLNKFNIEVENTNTNKTKLILHFI